MDSSITHEAVTHTEEQISVSIRKSSKHIEGVAVHCKRDARGKR
jgi:hypothetical protein